MTGELRVVVDTNVLISAMLFPQSKPGQVLKSVVVHGRLLVSRDAMSELNDVLRRPKFDRFATAEQRLEFVAALIDESELIDVHTTLMECRDPKDNKFLELAVDGAADVVVSGDSDLRILSPFRGIPIVSPEMFLTDLSQLSDD